MLPEKAAGRPAFASEDPLSVAADAGRFILESGGETYRAEEAVTALCAAWGLEEAECFATPTGIMASAAYPDGRPQAVVRRVSRRSVDLRRIALISDAVGAAALGKADPDSFSLSLQEIASNVPYPYAGALLAAAAAAAFFALLFGGTPRDAAAAFFVGAGIKVAAGYSTARRFPDFIVNIVGGFVAAALSYLAVELGLAENLDKTVIGAIMLLVPGLATVNAIRDTIAGDLVAGVARLAEALMAAAALSIGTGFALSLAAVLARLS